MGKVKRIYVKKKQGFDMEAKRLLTDLKIVLGIDELEALEIINRYDIEDVDGDIEESIFQEALVKLFFDPVVDDVFFELDPLIIDAHKKPGESNLRVLSMAYQPGQFDQRADVATQGIRLLNGKGDPLVRTGMIYLFYGDITEEQYNKIRIQIMNPLDAILAPLETPKTLKDAFVIVDKVAVHEGFTAMNEKEAAAFLTDMGLAMSLEDLLFVIGYFRDREERDPTVTEIKVLDTYWSDHCRHTTFHTVLDSVSFDEGFPKERVQKAYQKYLETREVVHKGKQKDISLMDIATLGMKTLRQNGLLDDLDVSDEINACSIKTEAVINGKKEQWLVMFKNETHNHPTEVEPFGGASTCLGGAIRDPLSGRAYVYQAMRITGAANPLQKVEDTMPGRLPQVKITRDAAKGYSSYGNQIGVPAGYVQETYHPGFVAKRMELGAVISGVPAGNVRREKPCKGDVVILLGGPTGRDGLGGATGSSKEHDEDSLSSLGAEVQKGNPPIERNIQRLFRDKAVSRLIKKCNDFGAGGVSVAIGELTDSLDIYLDKVPVKYEGLDGTEIAISESQERMAVVVAREDAEGFIKAAALENLEAVVVADVTDINRMRMFWKGQTVVDLDRTFIDTNGVRQKAEVHVASPSEESYFASKNIGMDQLEQVMASLDNCSQKGLIEMFDATVGASTVIAPLGGKHQLTRQEGMVAKLPVETGDTDTCTVMTHGYDPYIGQWSPYHGAAYAVIESLVKVSALGADWRKSRLSFQEYFEKLSREPAKWGKPFSALLAAFEAQLALGIPAIGGKDSMSGTYKDVNVPPTLVSFAVCVSNASQIRSAELKEAGNTLYWLPLKKDTDLLPDYRYVALLCDFLSHTGKEKGLVSCAVVKGAGVMETLCRTAFGNGLGIRMRNDVPEKRLFSPEIGSVVIETNSLFNKDLLNDLLSIHLGEVQAEPVVSYQNKQYALADVQKAWENTLEPIFPARTSMVKDLCEDMPAETFSVRPNKRAKVKIARPKVFVPIFPGTNGEYDVKRAFTEAGGDVFDYVFKNRTNSDIGESFKALAKAIGKTNIMILPGGASGGDQPEGAGKFMATILQNPYVAEALEDFLKNKDGLILGIGNGFQGLVRLGLLPYGEMRTPKAGDPVLTVNASGGFVSTIVRTKVFSVSSPWFLKANTGDVHTSVFSCREGRFEASDTVMKMLLENGQIATRYVDLDNHIATGISHNPGGSLGAVDAITSPDGRILGRMTHPERMGANVCMNVPYKRDLTLFESGIAYFE